LLNAQRGEIYVTREKCATHPNSNMGSQAHHLWTRGEILTEKIGHAATLPHLHVNGVDPLSRAEQREESDAHLHC
jgi:hypothetical protein